MSKKRKRLETFFENPAKRSREDRRPKESFTLRDKLQLFAPILGAFLLMIVVVMKAKDKEYEKAIFRRVETWRTKHELTQSQADELLAIELKFHQYEKPLSVQRAPSHHDISEHRLSINERLAGTDDGH